MRSNRAIWVQALGDMEDEIAEKELVIEGAKKELEKLRFKKWSFKEMGHKDITFVTKEAG